MSDALPDDPPHAPDPGTPPSPRRLPAPPIASAGAIGSADAAAAVARLSRGWIVGAVVFGALAVGASVLAWNTQARVHVLEQELARRQQSSSEQATEARLMARQAADGVRDIAGKVGVLEDRVAESALQRSQVEDLIQSLSRSRDENILSDLESGVRVAMQQAALTGSADPITSALKQADERLARYNQPRLERVRRAVARDLDRTRSTPAIDVPALAIRLDEVSRMVDDLPLLSTPERAMPGAGGASSASSASVASGVAAPIAHAPAAHARTGPARPGAAASSAAATAPSDGWWDAAGRAWHWFGSEAWGEVRSLVRVTEIDHPEAMLVSPDQAFFLRENLKLRLLNARLSLLSRQVEPAQADLREAQATLDKYFDRGSRRVVAASDLLRQVTAQARQVTFPRPDETLAALAAAEAGH